MSLKSLKMRKTYIFGFHVLLITLVGCWRSSNAPVKVLFEIKKPFDHEIELRHVAGATNPTRLPDGTIVVAVDPDIQNIYDATNFPHGKWVKVEATLATGEVVTANVVKPRSAYAFTITTTGAKGQLRVKMTPYTP